MAETLDSVDENGNDEIDPGSESDDFERVMKHLEDRVPSAPSPAAGFIAGIAPQAHPSVVAPLVDASTIDGLVAARQERAFDASVSRLLSGAAQIDSGLSDELASRLPSFVSKAENRDAWESSNYGIEYLMRAVDLLIELKASGSTNSVPRGGICPVLPAISGLALMRR